MKRVYVDCDGCLLHDSGTEAEFRKIWENDGIDVARKWFIENCPNNLELNLALYLRLIQYREEGYQIILWTNRGIRLWKKTVENLELWGILDLFTALEFGDGYKTKAYSCEPDSISIDNDWSNLQDRPNPQLIPTFTA